MPRRWEPIQDLPPHVGPATSELRSLFEIWRDLRAEMAQRDALDDFTKRLGREWAVETGQIEGVYDLDRGITRTLIEQGIRAELIPPSGQQPSPELVAEIIRDHGEVLEGLFQFVRGERQFSKSYVDELHAALLRHQNTSVAVDQFGRVFETEVVKGRYKTRPNNPTRSDGILVEYCPPEHLDSEMDRLVELHRAHEAAGVLPEVEAAWLHHRFTQIHPYQDGNGRVARSLSSLVFLRAGWFPTVVTRDDRARYIGALESADAGDLSELVTLFIDGQRRALLEAIQAAADVEPATNVESAIGAVKRVLSEPLEPAAWVAARESATRLLDIALARLHEVAGTLRKELDLSRPDLAFRASEGTLFTGFLAGAENGLATNRRNYNRVLDLALSTGNDVAIKVEAQALGAKARGMIAILVAFHSFGESALATEQPFLVNYAEPTAQAEQRFRPWLESALARALTMWRKTL